MEPRRRSSSSVRANGTFRFPDYTQDRLDSETFEEEELDEISTPQPLANGLPPGLHSSARWPARKTSRKDGWSTWTGKTGGEGRGHGRQKSLGEAIQTVRTRKMSISENAHEIADSLKAPISLKLIVRTTCSHNIKYRMFPTPLLIPSCQFKAPLRLLVFHLHSHKHLLQIHPHDSQPPGNLNAYPIRPGDDLVSVSRLVS